MNPNREILYTYRQSDVLSTRTYDLNTLTFQSSHTNDDPRDPLPWPHCKIYKRILSAKNDRSFIRVTYPGDTARQITQGRNLVEERWIHVLLSIEKLKERYMRLQLFYLPEITSSRIQYNHYQQIGNKRRGSPWRDIINPKNRTWECIHEVN